MKIMINNDTVNLLSKAKQSKAKQSHNCLLNNNFKFYISKSLKAFKFLSVSILLHNLVKTILTSINFDSLSRKIKSPCLTIKKFYSKGVCNMKHTKNILKSLLITVMALSLLAVSCSKDESKPTNPTPTKTKVQVAKEAAAAAAANDDSKLTEAKTAATTASELATAAAEAATVASDTVKQDADTVKQKADTVKQKAANSATKQDALKTAVGELKTAVGALKTKVDALQ